MTAKEIEKAVLALPREERAALVRDVLRSLDDGPEDGTDSAWIVELDRRASEVSSGTAHLADWSEARQRIADRLKALRATAASR